MAWYQWRQQSRPVSQSLAACRPHEPQHLWTHHHTQCPNGRFSRPPSDPLWLFFHSPAWHLKCGREGRGGGGVNQMIILSDDHLHMCHLHQHLYLNDLHNRLYQNISATLVLDGGNPFSPQLHSHSTLPVLHSTFIVWASCLTTLWQRPCCRVARVEEEEHYNSQLIRRMLCLTPEAEIDCTETNVSVLRQRNEAPGITLPWQHGTLCTQLQANNYTMGWLEKPQAHISVWKYICIHPLFAESKGRLNTLNWHHPWPTSVICNL